MFDEIISLSLRQFQEDCRQLSEYHYPTVHNRGMRENHLGKALSRRIVATLASKQIDALFSQLEDNDPNSCPFFKITGEDFVIWLVTHRMLSGNKGCRRAVIEDISMLCEKAREYSDRPNQLILTVADHWMDKTSSSRSLPFWWLGHMPIHQADFLSQGIRLNHDDTSLNETLSVYPELINGKFRTYHPLTRKQDSVPLYKYILMTAQFSLNWD
ncbi:hypothetical protein NF212_24695 [Parasalinivibrio latis]|uniref:hypothetical protein n=1 Tax=Parasalinivibrio latis TaxID=2952610 RepID=UPI0030E02FAF